MKILVVQDGDWTKKGPHQQHHLMDSLSAMGHEVVVIGYDHLWKSQPGNIATKRTVTRNVSRTKTEASVTYISLSVIRAPILDYLTFYLSLRNELEGATEFEPDVIIDFTSIISSFCASRYARKRNIPHVNYWTDVTHTLIPHKSLSAIGILLEKYVLRKASMVIAVNEELRRYLVSMGAEPSRTHVIPGGVDLDRFVSSQTERNKVRRSLGISSTDLVLFYMGWIYDFSGLDEVIEELARTRDRIPQSKLLIVGEGDYFPNIERTVRRNGLEDRVILTGRVPFDSIPPLISASDVCILPARRNEVMERIVPIKLYEYLAMGKWVVSTKLPGVMTEFGDDCGVFYVDRPEEVLEKAREIIGVSYEGLAESVKRFIEERRWERIVADFYGLLLELVRRREFSENPTGNTLL